MRALLCCALLAACGPKVAPKTSAFDEEIATETAQPAPAAPVAPARPEAPPGKGLRSGTIERARLVAVLDNGPGAFLRQLEVAPHMDGNRFVGWELIQLLDRNGPLVDVDVVPGDVLLAINGKPLSRPDQLQTLWDSLRTANELRAQLWRGDARLELAFEIEPRVESAPATQPPVQLTK
jgi:S1-C subfamily serine protease